MPVSPADIDLDQSNLEDAVIAALEKRLGAQPTVYESDNFGVVAISRLDGIDSAKIDWQEVAAQLSRVTGIGVTCVANCYWTFDDQQDEEATFIAFDIVGVPDDYRDSPYRNVITATDPANLPSDADFDNLKQAKAALKSHLRELTARRETLAAAKKPDESLSQRIDLLTGLQNSLEAGDRKIVAAIQALDFDQAALLQAAPEDEPSAGPSM